VIASDQSQLQQVFMNLINNAIDAIGSNGNIDIIHQLDKDRINHYYPRRRPGDSRGDQKKFSIRSSRPNKVAKGPAWGCPSATASSKNGWSYHRGERR
jgi:hypothetical protein